MKKFALFVAFLLAGAILCSCTKSRESFFDYQKDLDSAEGTVVADGEEYSVCIYFDRDEEGPLRGRRVEYSAPETLNGLVFSREGGKITAEMEGVRITNTFFDEKGVFFLSELFCLSEGDITEIKNGKDNTTVAFGKSEGVQWRVTTDASGTPLEIEYDGDGGEYVFTVENLVYSENDS